MKINLQKYFALCNPGFSPEKVRKIIEQNDRFLLGTPGYGYCYHISICITTPPPPSPLGDGGGVLKLTSSWCRSAWPWPGAPCRCPTWGTSGRSPSSSAGRSAAAPPQRRSGSASSEPVVSAPWSAHRHWSRTAPQGLGMFWKLCRNIYLMMCQHIQAKDAQDTETKYNVHTQMFSHH